MSDRDDEPRRGFGEFFAAHYAAVVRGLSLATGNSQLAEDAAQEAFARAVRKWSRVRRMERPVGWVWAVAMNVARRQARRCSQEATSAADAPKATWVADTGVAVTTRIALREAISALPRRQREAVVLRYLADLSVADTATAMRCATGTVQSAVRAAQLRCASNSMRMTMKTDDLQRASQELLDRRGRCADRRAGDRDWPTLSRSPPSDPAADRVASLLPFATSSSDTVGIFLRQDTSRADTDALRDALERDADVAAVTFDPDTAEDLVSRIAAMTRRKREVEAQLRLMIGPQLPPIVYSSPDSTDVPNISLPPNVTDDAVLLLYERNALCNRIDEGRAEYAERKVSGARLAPKDALVHRFRVTVAPTAVASVAAHLEGMPGVAGVVTPAPVTCFTD